MNSKILMHLVCKIVLVCLFLLAGGLRGEQLLFPPTSRERILVTKVVTLIESPELDRKRLEKTLQSLDQVQAVRERFSNFYNKIKAYDAEVTAPHCRRVGRMAARFYEIYAQEQGRGVEHIEARSVVIRWGATVHDEGKTVVPKAILNKVGSLNNEEFARIKTHSSFGALLLRGGNTSIEKVTRNISRSHHERWDGTGYPHGLKGKSIPLSARFVAIVDVYDALSESRSYKKAWSMEKVLSVMQEGKGSQFDPKLLQFFLDHRESIAKAAHVQDHRIDKKLRVLGEFRKLLREEVKGVQEHRVMITRLGKGLLKSWGHLSVPRLPLLPSVSQVVKKKGKSELSSLFDGLNHKPAGLGLSLRRRMKVLKAKISRISKMKR